MSCMNFELHQSGYLVNLFKKIVFKRIILVNQYIRV